MEIRDLATPCAIVDIDAVVRNTQTMSRRARSLGVRLRPHVKTHKCLQVARLQIKGHFGGITVSTLAEAESLTGAGFRDITWAVPVDEGKIERAAGIAARIDRLNLLTDRQEGLDALETFARRRGIRFSLFLKVDCGYHRAGVDPDGEAGLALAWRCAESPSIDFRGILTHAGHAYHCRTPDEVRTVALQERDVMAAFAGRLREAGVAVPEVSVGSTPTVSLAEDLTGVTEVRPGNYSFYDTFQATLGSCRPEDVAFSVLTTVIGTYPERNTALVDAGSLALSSDPGPAHIDPDCGFGIPRTVSGEPLEGNPRILSVSQEHGILGGGAFPLDQAVKQGMKIRVLPNHACLAASQFDRYHVVQGERLVDTWTPVRGW